LIYEATDESRYILGELGTKNIICIGINPSIASPEKLDPTSRIIKKKSLELGYNGWLIINIYPQRATKPSDLKREMDEDDHKRNIHYIKNITCVGDTVWAAWGSTINKRKYLRECMIDVCSLILDKQWISIGPLSIDGHPHHPLFVTEKTTPEEFDIKSYIKENRNFY